MTGYLPAVKAAVRTDVRASTVDWMTGEPGGGPENGPMVRSV
jgi:hypothetical protein